MDPVGCLVCGQPDANCFRSNRRAFSFDVSMEHAFEELVALPCHSREMLNIYVDKWLVAECPHVSVYHFYVEKTESRSYLYGPYWSSLIDAYNIDEHDIVEFTYDEAKSMFDIEILNSERDEKPWVQLADCWEVLNFCRVTFQQTIFSNVMDVNSTEMNSVNFEIFKELTKIDETEYLEFFEVPQFLVHRLNEEGVTRLILPYDVARGYSCPLEGTAVFYSRAINGQTLGGYTIRKGQHVEFEVGWNDFCGLANIGIGSLLCVKIEFREFCIRLEIAIISN